MSEQSKGISSSKPTLIALGVIIAVALGWGAISVLDSGVNSVASEGSAATVPNTDGAATSGKSVTPKYAESVSKANEERAKNNSTSVDTFLNVNNVDGFDVCSADKEERDKRIKELEDNIVNLNQTHQAQMLSMQEQIRKIQAIKSTEQQNKNVYAFPYFRTEVDGKPIEFMSDEGYRTEKGHLEKYVGDIRKQLDSRKEVTPGIYITKNENCSGANCSSSSSGKTIGDEKASFSGKTQLADAGDVFYANLDTMINSDLSGPVRATIYGGKFDKAVLIGSAKLFDEYLIVEFDKMSYMGKTYSIKAIAVDPATTSIGLQDDVDRHYFSRFVAVLGAAFLQGYGDAVVRSNQHIAVGATGGIYQSTVIPESKFGMVALGEVGKAAAEMIKPYAKRPITVTKDRNSSIGIMLTDAIQAQ